MKFTRDEILDRYIEEDYITIADEDQDSYQEANYELMVFKAEGKYYKVWITQYWGAFIKERMSVDVESVSEVEPKKKTITVWEEV